MGGDDGIPGLESLATRMSRKPTPAADAAPISAEPPPSQSLFIQFQDAQGTTTGAPISIPASTTPAQLESLLHQLLLAPKAEADEEPLPYTFYIHDQEITTSLHQDIVVGGHASIREGILPVVYRPQAVFRVRPISRCTSTLAGHQDTILCVSFSPDGRRLASGSGDNAVRFWDLDTETPLKVASGGHTGWVLCLAWSPDGKYLASGGMDGSICIWEGQGAAVGTLRAKLLGHRKWITALAWEPLHLLAVGAASRLASSSKDGTAKVWDSVRGTCLFTLSQHTDAVSCIRWGGDGTIYTGSRDRTIRMWQPIDGRLKGQLSGHAHWVNSLALSTDHVLRTGAFDHEGRVATPENLPAAAKTRYEAALKACDGVERLISASDDFTLFLWEPSRGNKPVARLTGHQALVNHVAFSPDGCYLASAGFDRSVKLWDGRKGTFLASLRGHVGRVYQVAWAADSRMLITSSQDSTLKVWNVRTRTLKQDLPGHLDEVYAVDWSPIGDRGASGGRDKMLKLWRN